MTQFENWLTALSDLVWGPHLLILLIGTGIFLTVRLGFIQVTRLGFGLREAFIPKAKAEQKKQRGDITHFQALMTALMMLTAFVILGGVKSIGKVVGVFVPVMIFAYVGGGLTILVMNFELIPSAFATIFASTFSAEAIGGGALGAAIRYGVARGVFSNEAGLGSAPIAAAAAKTDFPGRQALVSMTQVLIDTLIVCSITGLTIVMSGQYASGLQGIELTQALFAYFLGPVGELIVTISLVFFAFSTVIGWCYYGERSIYYLFGERSIVPYRVLYIVVAGLGAMTTNLNLIWAISDVFNGLMAIPNLIGLLFLSGVVVAETKRFELERQKELRKSIA